MSALNGYAENYVVESVRPAGNRPRNNLIVVAQGDPTQTTPGDAPQQHAEWTVPFWLMAFFADSESADDAPPADQRINAFCADVERAFTDDYQRGNMANDTMIGDPVQVPIDNDTPGFSAVLIPVTVTYRTLWGDPFSQ